VQELFADVVMWRADTDVEQRASRRPERAPSAPARKPSAAASQADPSRRPGGAA
jgi:hypothetical protein